MDPHEASSSVDRRFKLLEDEIKVQKDMVNRLMDSEPSVDRRLRLLEDKVKLFKLEDKVDLLATFDSNTAKGEDASLVHVLNDSSDEVHPFPVMIEDDSAPVKKRAKKKRKKKMKRGASTEVATWGSGRRVFTKLIVGLVPIALLFSLALGQGGIIKIKETSPLRKYLATLKSDSTKREDEGIAAQTPSLLRKQQSQKTADHARLMQSNDTQSLNPTIPSTASSVPPASDSRPPSSPSMIPSTSSPLSISSSSALTQQTCQVADKETCGCANVLFDDYRGTINVSEENGEACIPWDSDMITNFYGFSLPTIFPDHGLVENYCRNPGRLNEKAGCISAGISENGDNEHFCDVPICDPCSCMPECGTPNIEACGCPSFLQAETCCGDALDVASCKCGYLKEACSKSLASGSTDFCDLAGEACCEASGAPYCQCNMFEQMCSENPSDIICGLAADKCCPRIDPATHDNFVWGDEVICKCEFYTYVSNVLGFGRETQLLRCAESKRVQNQSANRKLGEKTKLENLYKDTKGQYWFNNEGWETDSEYCNWYGVKCNNDNFLVELKLRKNNLTGTSCWRCRLDFEDLITLDLAQNQIELTNSSGLLYNRKMEYVDLAENICSGHVDVLQFPALKYFNVSHNRFTSAGFKRFNLAYNTIRNVDLSSNYIALDASEIFLNIPPTLEYLSLSNNNIGGFLQEKFPRLHFAMANTSVSGPLPDFPNTAPQLRYLDLGNNRLTGTIPADIFKLGDLSVLNLAGNNLEQSIPSAIGDLSQLRFLNLSSNSLSQTIPIKLAKLKDVIEMFDLSSNTLTGIIPVEIGSFNGDVLLSGNSLVTPAPLDLCFSEGFDRINDVMMCPPERNALREFYYSTKGQEWTESTNWISQYKSHCSWYGVSCDDSNKTVTLDLRSNSLSGKLSEGIGVLRSIRHLDLGDNDLKGSIPTEIGLLSKLSYLRLSYNKFIRTMPREFQELSQLEFIHLHGNSISGMIPFPQDAQALANQASFISDCGVPSMFEQTLRCENCTMCCNSQNECFPTEPTELQKSGFVGYLDFTWAFFLGLIGGCCILHLASFMYGEYQDRVRARSMNILPSALPRVADGERDNKYALDAIGNDSVYMFFLGTSWWGWGFALTTLTCQIAILYVFVLGSEFDLTNDISDLVYTFRCPKDTDSCGDTSDLDWRGWLAFAILMGAHLLKDMINGSKMIVLSAKKRHSTHKRLRFFFGGMFLIFTSLFALFVTSIYNKAIATSNTSIIENAVIVLFVTDLDEMLFRVLMSINPRWVSKDETETGDTGRLDVLTIENKETKDSLNQMQLEMEKLRGVIERMQERAGRAETPLVETDGGGAGKGANYATAEDEGSDGDVKDAAG